MDMSFLTVFNTLQHRHDILHLLFNNMDPYTFRNFVYFCRKYISTWERKLNTHLKFETPTYPMFAPQLSPNEMENINSFFHNKKILIASSPELRLM